MTRENLEKIFFHKLPLVFNGRSISSPLLDSYKISYDGFYAMQYDLDDNSSIKIVMNHLRNKAQIIIKTQDTQLIKKLPGKHSESLVQQTISYAEAYLNRIQHYPQPLTNVQQKKRQIARDLSGRLIALRKKEREISLMADRLNTNDTENVSDKINNSVKFQQGLREQETLRREVLRCIELARDENRKLASRLTASEGQLGEFLYEAREYAQRYHFNTHYSVTPEDQMDFSSHIQQGKTIVWDSDVAFGQDENLLKDTLRVLIKHYVLEESDKLKLIEANRFHKLKRMGINLTQDFIEMLKYYYHKLSFKHREHPPPTKVEVNNLKIQKSHPDYVFVEDPKSPILSNDRKVTGNDLYTLLTLSERHLYWPEKFYLSFGAFLSNIPEWAFHSYDKIKLFIVEGVRHNFVTHIHQDHLLVPLLEREILNKGIKLSQEQIHRFNELYIKKVLEQALYQFESHNDQIKDNSTSIVDECLKKILDDEEITQLKNNDYPKNNLINCVQKDLENTIKTIKAFSEFQKSVSECLKKHGFLPNGQSVDEFIKNFIETDQKIVLAAPINHHHDIHYRDPFHRALDITRHIANVFIAPSEKHPVLGTLAMGAYLYGASSILAPAALTALFTKLHIGFAAAGISPTQMLAALMSHGTTSEAISASATFWQLTMLSGQFDDFFRRSVDILKDNPAEVVIITSLALGLGYGLCQAIPALGKEMGEYPVMNYGAIGAKGGMAIFDVISHPGDDWLLGTIKWLLSGILILTRITLTPFIEGYYYGFFFGFMNGLIKSFWDTVILLQATIATVLDLALVFLTFPLIEIPSLLIHVPFRGITGIAATFINTFMGDTISNLFNDAINMGDRTAGFVKQRLLSEIEIWRQQIYYWSFKDTTPAPHDKTAEYFKKDLQHISRVSDDPNALFHLLSCPPAPLSAGKVIKP